MRRRIRAWVAALFWAVPASAGLHIAAPPTYAPGDLIGLTVTGDSEGAVSAIVRVLLTVDADLVLVSGAPGVLNDSNATYDWAQTAVAGTCGADGSVGPTQCVAVDAYGPLFIGPALDILPSTLSTFTFDTTNATGDLFFSLDPDGAGFFGLPGTSAVVAMIPEPATGALMSLGWVALAVRRRQRRV